MLDDGIFVVGWILLVRDSLDLVSWSSDLSLRSSEDNLGPYLGLSDCLWS